MRRTVLCCHLCSVWLYHYFFTFSQKRHDFQRRNEHKICVLIFSANWSEIFVVIRGNQRDVDVNELLYRSLWKISVDCIGFVWKIYDSTHSMYSIHSMYSMQCKHNMYSVHSMHNMLCKHDMYSTQCVYCMQFKLNIYSIHSVYSMQCKHNMYSL